MTESSPENPMFPDRNREISPDVWGNIVREMDILAEMIEQTPADVVGFFPEKGKPMISKGKDLGQEYSFNMFAVGEPTDGVGMNTIDFGNRHAAVTEEPEEVTYPKEFPRFPKYILTIHNHTEPDTLEQVREYFSKSNSKFGIEDLKTSYYVDDEGRAWKLMIFPDSIPYDLPPIIRHEEYDYKVVAAPMTGGDAEQVLHTLNYLKSQISHE